MQNPPPFNNYERPMGSKPKKNPVVIIFAILGVLLVCCGLPIGAAFYYGKQFVSSAMGFGGCMVNVEALSQAVKDYAAKNNGNLPKAESWQTDLAAYLKIDADKDSEKMLNLWKKDGEWSCTVNEKKYGFVFNKALSGQKLQASKDPKNPEILIYQSTEFGFNKVGDYKPQTSAEAPQMFPFIPDAKGWIIITRDGETDLIGKDGKVARDKKGRKISFGMGSRGQGSFEADVTTNSEDSSNK